MYRLAKMENEEKDLMKKEKEAKEIEDKHLESELKEARAEKKRMQRYFLIWIYCQYLLSAIIN